MQTIRFVFVVLSQERRRVVHFGVTEHPTQEWTMQRMREAFPWDQAPGYVLRDVIVWNERSLRRTLHTYLAYYQRSRTHLALGKDAPEPRAVDPPEQGCVVAIPQVGGLHHRYERRAA